jgi:hypothetical protein
MHHNEAESLSICLCNIDFWNQRTEIDQLDHQRLCLSNITNDFPLFAPKRGCVNQNEAEGVGICPCTIDFWNQRTEIERNHWVPQLTKITNFPYICPQNEAEGPGIRP